MIRYYITDGSQFAGTEALIENIARQVAAGVEMIQLRERDLTGRELFAFAERIMRLPNPRATRILINDRSDVALSVGAAGVHLRGNSIAPSQVRAIAPRDFAIGVSCHSVEDVVRAEREGASFTVLAPIYSTPGKGPALGLGPLREAAQAVRVPVIALGGLTPARVGECLAAGASGIAGISMFQQTIS